MKSIEQKRKEAQERAAARAQRTPAKQLEIIHSSRPGDSWKETKRLVKLMTTSAKS